MSQYNLGSTNNTGAATLVVSAGSPRTLILNHSTKNTVLIGKTSAVGSGNLLDATPLDPYASVVVDGSADVYAIAETAGEDATVYTYENAVAWTPKAVQPNIIDPNSPWMPAVGSNAITLDVPASAQGLFISWNVPGDFSELTVTGAESGIRYYQQNPNNIYSNEAWIPILSDADTHVEVSATTLAQPSVSLVWIMSAFMSSLVDSGMAANVTVVASNIPGGLVTTPNGLLSTGQQAPNQAPVAFDLTIAAGTSATLLPASAGITYYLHSMRIEPHLSATFNCTLTQTGAATGAIADLAQETSGTTPTGAFRPAYGPLEFHGAPVGPAGTGLEIVNNSSSSQEFVGFFTYSE